MNKNKIQSDIIQSAIAMKAHYDTWRALVSEGRLVPAYPSIMLNHSDFIRISEHAHYTAAYVYFAHLYDKRDDSSSILKYISLIEKDIDVAIYDDLKQKYKQLEIRAKPLLKVRHKLVAHIDAKLTEKGVLNEDEVIENEVQSVMHDTAELVALLVGSKSGEIGIPGNERLTIAVLNVLKKLAN